jgi:hypothetical protein
MVLINSSRLTAIHVAVFPDLYTRGAAEEGSMQQTERERPNALDSNEQLNLFQSTRHAIRKFDMLQVHGI